MDLTEALLHRYTTSVVSILNAVRATPEPAPSPRPTVSTPKIHRRARARPRAFLPSVSDPRLVSPTAQGPLDGSSDASRSLSSLRDLLPALAALAPTGASPLIDAPPPMAGAAAARVGPEQRLRLLLWQSQILQLAFWHAVHRILAPLPPGALPDATSSRSSTPRSTPRSRPIDRRPRGTRGLLDPSPAATPAREVPRAPRTPSRPTLSYPSCLPLPSANSPRDASASRRDTTPRRRRRVSSTSSNPGRRRNPPERTRTSSFTPRGTSTWTSVVPSSDWAESDATFRRRTLRFAPPRRRCAR